MSRNSLREAVKALEVIRVLDVRRGDGTYVTSLEPSLLLEALNFVVDLHSDQSVLELFGVRRILEPEAAAIAARTIDAATSEKLERLIEEVDADATIEDLVAHDLAFHQTIASATGNEYLARLVESMSSSTVRARVWRGITQHGAAARTIAEHRVILAALRRGDADLVRAEMLTHIAGIKVWLRDAINVDRTGSTDSAHGGDNAAR